jgi:hypothetical protein
LNVSLITCPPPSGDGDSKVLEIVSCEVDMDEKT